MTGIHVFYPNDKRAGIRWEESEKKYVKNENDFENQFIIYDFEVPIITLSILNWKKFNGKIKLYTNDNGYEMFQSLNLIDYYDEVDITTIDDQLDKYEIDDNVFWACYKLLVLETLKTPFTILDLDLYLETTLNKKFLNADIGLLHFEDESMTYPFYKNIMGIDRVDWPDSWNFHSNPVNVALTYFGNQDALNQYTDLAIKFMDGNVEPSKYDVFMSRMPFAEQAILGELVDKSDFSTEVLITGLYKSTFHSDNAIGFHDVKNLRPALFLETSNPDTLHYHSNLKVAELMINHLWGYKAILLKDRNYSSEFIERICEKVIKDFPQTNNKLMTGLDNWYNGNKRFKKKI
jgi:hypothetical protein